MIILCVNVPRDRLRCSAVLVSLFAMALVACSGCTNSSEATSNAGRETADEPARLKVERNGMDDSPAVVVRDLLGRRVAFAESPERIVSLTPSTTELLYAIGAGHRIVAATKHCNYPSEASELPRVGGGTMESISREKLLGAQPDLVLFKWDHHEPLLETLNQFQVPALALGPESLDELYEETLVLGAVTGYEPNSRQLVAELKQRVAALTARVREIPPDERPSVFYQVWDEPLMTAGPDSFIGEILGLAGTENIFSDLSIRYPRVSSEAVVARDPDVILVPSVHADAFTRETIMNRQGWEEVSAVREGRVYVIDGDPVSRCGPRLIDALEEIIRVVHPELSQ